MIVTAQDCEVEGLSYDGIERREACPIGMLSVMIAELEQIDGKD